MSGRVGELLTLGLSNNPLLHNQYLWSNGRKIAIRIYDKSNSTVNGLNTNRFEDDGQVFTGASFTSSIFYNSL